MATNADVASRFACRGRDIKSLSMFTRGGGQMVFSYGEHYLLAEHISPDTALVNTVKYSQTTSRHRSEVVSALSREGYSPALEDPKTGNNGHTFEVWTRR